MTTPKQPKIPLFLEMGLFNGLQSFAELESRIEALETDKEKGEALEVFALAYISSSIGKSSCKLPIFHGICVETRLAR